MFNIDYNLLLNDPFVLSLTNNILKSQSSLKSIQKDLCHFVVVENNSFKSILDDDIIIKILNCIHLFKLTKDDPFIIFKLRDQKILNSNNFDSNLYNTICISILSNENKNLRKQLNQIEINENNKRRRIE